jgi:hypothetical protein
MPKFNVPKEFPIRPNPEWVRNPGENRRGATGGRRRGPPNKYPFDKLEVGQSFIAPLKLRKTLSVLACYHGPKLGCKFAVVQLEYDPSKIAVCRTE